MPDAESRTLDARCAEQTTGSARGFPQPFSAASTNNESNASCTVDAGRESQVRLITPQAAGRGPDGTSIDSG